MAANIDVTLTNNDNNRAFLFRAVSPLKNKVSQNVQSLPFANTTPENTFLFRFFGKTEDIMFTFAIFDDNVDVANGTHGSTIKTVNEQITYLKDYIFTEDFDVDWTLVQARYAASPGITGVITNLDIDNPAGYVGVVIGSLAFKRGRIGSL